MIKIRLFWKFFFAYLLASIILFSLTALVLVQGLEKNRLSNHHQQMLYNYASMKIEQFERGKPTSERWTTRFPRHHGKDKKNRFFEKNGLRILTDNKPIYELNGVRLGSGTLVEFEMQSLSGNTYVVQTQRPRLPQVMVDAFKKMGLLQLLCLFVASALVSALLSWRFSQPLKILGRVSRQYGADERVDEEGKALATRGDEIGDLANDIFYMIQRVDEKSSSQRSLLHDVSHELRAPLARLQVAAELLKKSDSGNNIHIERIHLECEQIDQLISNILNFSKLENSEVLKERVDLAALVKRKIKDIQYEFPQRELKLSVPGVPLFVLGYPELLDASIENVLRNACKHTEEETGIDVRLSSNISYAELVVRDYGKGVESDVLTRLAQPFYRRRISSELDGFGLGLSIVAKAMERHSGSLSISNHPEGGLKVVLKFNLFDG